MEIEKEDAEKGLLGTLLLSPEKFDSIKEKITADCFKNPVYAKIFSAMQYLSRNGRDIDIILLKNELERRNEFEFIGGASALQSLMDYAPTGEHCKLYAEVIEQSAKRGEG